MSANAALEAGQPAPVVFRTIRKRNKSVSTFDAGKITNAILKAAKVTGEFAMPEARRLTIRVLSLAQTVMSKETLEVEEIQDLVEEVLLASPYKRTAKAYILYREQHKQIRKITAKADVKLIDNYLERLDWQVEENSNMGYSLQGLNNYIASEVSKTYWLNSIYSQEVREAHESGDLHIMTWVYCLFIVWGGIYRIF